MIDTIKKHLSTAPLMQLATSVEDRPWVCSVYFVVDDQLNVYWLSLPTRRHSVEIGLNKNVAGAVVVKKSMPVIGVQIEGRASLVKDKKTVKEVMETYTAKYDEGTEFYKNFLAGKNKHELYQLRPDNIVVFDEVADSKHPRKQWRVMKDDMAHG